MKSNIISGALFGVPVGLLVAWYWFNTWDWYHNFVVSCWTNPYLLGVGGLIGLTVAVLEDKQADT